MTKSPKIHLVVVDPQLDFCTPNGKYNLPTGTLYVPGADQDMTRLATFIRRVKQKLADIHITLDSHHLLDVSHPLFWKNAKGQHANPFTIITVADIEKGIWTPSVPSLHQRMLVYVRALQQGGRYPLCIWPPHCLIGTLGQIVVPELMDALNEWAALKRATIDFMTKGSNPFTEHYSAVRAEVPDPTDPTTHLNKAFIQTIEDADMVVWAGEAASHGLAETIRDTTEHFSRSTMEKMVLLTDATSAVPGFESYYEDFLGKMKKRGMQTATTVDFLA